MKEPANAPTRRFSNRVEYYIRSRPHYPAAILDFLQRELGLLASHRLADVGSGTGILAEMFLKNGNIVFGIEPNREMREAGEELLREHANFRSIAATAEATMLPNESVDFVVAGQAFHWFDPNQTKEEFQRIIRPEGYVVLIWNERQEATLFAEDYQRLLDKYSIDLAQVGHKTITSTSDATLERFFLPHGFSTRTFDNYQLFDYAGLEGRLLSSSYIPLAGDPSFEPMLAELHSIFDRHQLKGAVEFKYDTRVFYGRLK